MAARKKTARASSPRKINPDLDFSVAVPPARPALERVVTITLPVSEARNLCAGMADLLCWIAGFKAACPDDSDRHPMGVHDTRNVRIFLMSAIERAQPIETGEPT